MSLQDAIAYDAQRVLCSVDEFAEEVELVPASGVGFRVNALWGQVEKDTERHRLVAHWADVYVPSALLVQFADVLDLRRTDRAVVVRLPDSATRRQEWKIANVEEESSLTHFEVFTLARPVGKGAA